MDQSAAQIAEDSGWLSDCGKEYEQLTMYEYETKFLYLMMEFCNVDENYHRIKWNQHLSNLQLEKTLLSGDIILFRHFRNGSGVKPLIRY